MRCDDRVGAHALRFRYQAHPLLYCGAYAIHLTIVGLSDSDLVFHEQWISGKLLSFIVVWIALAIFTVSALREDRARRTALAATAL